MAWIASEPIIRKLLLSTVCESYYCYYFYGAHGAVYMYVGDNGFVVGFDYSRK